MFDISFAALPLWFWAATAFLMAACVGSFLNVVVARVPRDESIVWPGSHCFTCGAPIAARHNLPILSWFLLRGRCHDCKAPFSIRYALVELAFAALCCLAVVRHGGPTHAAFEECALLALLIPLACIDLDTWTLPHSLTIPGIAIGLAFALPLGQDILLNRLLAAGIGYAVLFVGGLIGERVLGKEAMGGGDFFLFALIGAFLGTRALLPVIFLASLQGSVVGIAQIAQKRLTNRSATEDGEGADSEEAGDSRESATENSEGNAPEHSAEKTTEKAAETEQSAAANASLSPADDNPLRINARIPDDGWEPDPHSIPFGPFLALGAAEVLYFSHLPDILFPWIP